MTVTFGFALGQKVEIRELKCQGLIEGARVCGNGMYTKDSMLSEYLVSYWFNGERKTQWIPGVELDER